MTFQQLYYVSEVAKLGSINRAAKSLFVSQSTISNAIKELESEFRLQLFVRTASGISITSSGKRFLSYARSLIDQKERTEKIFKISASKKFSQLTIASQHIAYSSKALIDLIHNSMDHEFEFVLKEINIGSLIDDVSHGHSDIGIVFISDIMMSYVTDLLNDHYLEYHELCKLSPTIRVRADHPLTKLENICKNDLLPYPYLAMYQDYYTVPFEHNEAARLFSDYKPTRVIYVNDRATIYDMLVGTDAYHFSSGLLSDRERRETVSLQLHDWDWSVHLAWIKLKNESLSSDAQLFIDNFTSAIMSLNA